jgi:hypothetical protein
MILYLSFSISILIRPEIDGYRFAVLAVWDWEEAQYTRAKCTVS